LSPLLRQSDEQFGYEVVSRILDRSADAIRFIDTLFFALMASQAAIYAIILDKVQEYPATGWRLLFAGLIVATLGIALTIFVREAPNPRSFVADFPHDPDGTRRRYMANYIVEARRNEQLRIAKAIVLGLALALTVVPVAIATASRAGGI
jgi:hypothetical protein